MPKDSTWTISMMQCNSCIKKTDCVDRKTILKTLSQLTHAMNMDESEGFGAGGTIIVNCGR